ncbi:hypothetical protein EZV73_22105 [Acidaminobacter sp. JC074]|uniref:hypothetical protein n=1 Tax=Acidaminobacter sp. JC074 TaxID=2530199 RepID=UPI001F112137|nr:hypothetical protein [Acidaminobacter sp. JC074]MCH4890292.1 hypothetical protein [Acidaminobacter sp. JC074]
MKFLKYITILFIFQLIAFWTLCDKYVGINFYSEDNAIYRYLIIGSYTVVSLLVIVFLGWVNNKFLDKLVLIDQQVRYASLRQYDELKDNKRHEMIRDYQKLMILISENKRDEVEEYFKRKLV